MVKPPRKFTPEEVAANDQARVEREVVERGLKQEGISRVEASRNRGAKRKNRTDTDEISVISASVRPKELQGHNEFDGAPHWATPTHRRPRNRPSVFISNMNNVGSPTSSIESPLGPTQRQTHTSNDGDSESDKDVVEKPFIGSRVAVRRASAIHFGTIISCATLEGRNHYCIKYDDRIIVEVNTIELSRLQQLYIEEMNNDTVGHQKQKSQSTQDDEYVGTRVSFMCERIAFYGTVQRCSLSDRSSRQKMWYIKYDGGDEEEIFRPKMNERRRHYARHGMNDPTLPAILPPQLPPPSTAKKGNTRRTTKQQQPTTAKKKKVPVTNRKKKTATKQRAVKKKSVKKKTKKKKDTTAKPKPRLHNADDETVATHGNYSPKVPYSYEVQYKDGSHPKYTPFVLKDQF